jgi:hypothetical protein
MRDTINLASSATTSDPLSLNFSHLTDWSFLPTWQSLPIEMGLRHFIKILGRHLSHQEWINLPRNSRYLLPNCSVDWFTTFSNLSDDPPAPPNSTSFVSSGTKRNRVSLLLESLPTLAKLQQQQSHIYDSQFDLCTLCHSQPETFEHVWLCTDLRQRNAMLSLMDSAFDHFMTLLSFFGPSDIVLPSRPAYWSLPAGSFSTSTSLCFVDLIKGCVPTSLVGLVHSLTSSSPTTLHIISELFHYIQTKAFGTIWRPRCDDLQLLLQHMNITRALRRTHAPSGSQPSRSQVVRSACALDFVDSPNYISDVTSFIHSSVDKLSHFRFISSLVVFIFLRFFWRRF